MLIPNADFPVKKSGKDIYAYSSGNTLASEIREGIVVESAAIGIV